MTISYPDHKFFFSSLGIYKYNNYIKLNMRDFYFTFLFIINYYEVMKKKIIYLNETLTILDIL